MILVFDSLPLSRCCNNHNLGLFTHLGPDPPPSSHTDESAGLSLPCDFAISTWNCPSTMPTRCTSRCALHTLVHTLLPFCSSCMSLPILTLDSPRDSNWQIVVPSGPDSQFNQPHAVRARVGCWESDPIETCMSISGALFSVLGV